MKRNSKILIAFILAMTFLSVCKKANDSAETDKEIVNQINGVSKEKEVSKKKEVSKENSLEQVDGAMIGSLSSFIEDRKVWNEFIDKEFLDSAKNREKDMYLPRILLDSVDAKKVNSEIDAIVKKMKEVYKAKKFNMENGDTGIAASFSVYQNEKILSIMIEEYDIYHGDDTNHHVFNFSLPGGEFIDDAELIKDFGVEKDEILTLVENRLTKEAELASKIYCKDITDLSYIYNLNNLVSPTLNDLWDNYNKKSHKLFLNEVGRSKFVFDNYESAYMEQISLIFELESNRFERSIYSDQYIGMTRGLGLNPYDKNNKAFVVYLGGANSEKDLKAPLSKLQIWSNISVNYEDPNMIVAVKRSEGDTIPYLIGEECYLIIPEYKNASASLKELELTKDGKLKKVKNPYLDSSACSRTTLIYQNISDTSPNGKIVIRYRDDVVEFSPRLSLKDGSLAASKGIIDRGKIIDWSREVQDDFYLYIMPERIKYLIGVG